MALACIALGGEVALVIVSFLRNEKAREGGFDNCLQMNVWSQTKITRRSQAVVDLVGGCMNEAAQKLIKEAVLRALQKSPADVTFYHEQIDDPSLPPAYRMSLREAVDEWMRRSS